MLEKLTLSAVNLAREERRLWLVLLCTGKHAFWYQAGSESTALKATYTLAPSGHRKTPHPENTAVAGVKQRHGTGGGGPQDSLLSLLRRLEKSVTFCLRYHYKLL